MALGEAIRAARCSKGLSLRAAGRGLAVSATHLSDIENGRRVPSEPLLRDLAEYLGVELDQLLVAAGRIPEEVRSFVQDNPAAVGLLRRLAGLGGGQLSILEQYLDGVLAAVD